MSNLTILKTNELVDKYYIVSVVVETCHDSKHVEDKDTLIKRKEYISGSKR